MKKHFVASAALAAAVALVLSACAAEEPAPAETTEATETTESATTELSGTILLDGSSTVGPFAEAAAELFMMENPGVSVTVGISGTGGGFEKFCNGETDGSNASREIKDEEAALCDTNGVGYQQVVVANDALSVIVNKDNPLECISVEALNAIWNVDSTLATWGEIPGIEAGDLASEAIVLYGPGTDSGTFDFFTEEINGEAGNIRTDYNNIGEDDNQAVQGVAGGVGAMAFIPYSFYQEYSDQVKGLQIDNGSGCVPPDIEHLLDGTYAPLGRQLFSYASADSLARPEVAAFYQFIVEQNETIAEAAGLVSLTPEQKDEQLAAVAAFAG